MLQNVNNRLVVKTDKIVPPVEPALSLLLARLLRRPERQSSTDFKRLFFFHHSCPLFYFTFLFVSKIHVS